MVQDVAESPAPSSQVTIITDVQGRGDLVVSSGDRGTLVLSGAPGRLFWNHVYDPAGEYIEKVGGFVASKLGIGPSAHARAIIKILEEDPGSKLDALYKASKLDSAPRENLGWMRLMKKHCIGLMEYVHPHKAKLAQINAFRWIVLLSTWHPGIRPLFRLSKHAKDIDNEPSHQSLWAREDGEEDEEWQFYQSLATCCLSNTLNVLAFLLENCRPDDLGKIPVNESSIVERLLYQFLHLHASKAIQCLALRYITGILRLKSFWIEDKTCYVTSKLSKECIILLGYLSDHLASSSDRSLQFDIEGIDMHVEELIHGLIQQEHTAMKQANHEEWCKSVSDLKRLLDRPQLIMTLPRTGAIRDKLMIIQTSPNPGYSLEDLYIVEKSTVPEKNGLNAREKPIIPTDGIMPPAYPTSDSNRSVDTVGLKPTKPAFGIDLSEQMARDRVEVPKLLKKCCEAIESFGIETKGIYKINGKTSKVLKMKEQLDRDIDAVIFKRQRSLNIHTITSVIKLWLEELPEPLVTYALYQEFIERAKIANERLRYIRLHEHVNLLPDANYATLRFFIEHLHNISQNEVRNEMSKHNLSVIFGPVLFDNTSKISMDMEWQIIATETILERYVDTFVEEPE